jgi:hypothetical protein
MGDQMGCAEIRRGRLDGLEGWHRALRQSVAVTLLAALVLVGGGCARQEPIEAAGVTEAPVVTVHTLPLRHHARRKAQLVSNTAASPDAASTEQPKPSPRPRRRRARWRKEAPAASRQPLAPAPVAATRENGSAGAGEALNGEAARQPSPDRGAAPKAAPAPPEHVIEPRPPSPPTDAAPPPDPKRPDNSDG